MVESDAIHSPGWSLPQHKRNNQNWGGLAGEGGMKEIAARLDAFRVMLSRELKMF